MIRITPETVQFAAALADVRRPPARTDGTQSWIRHHGFSYSGAGFLTFLTTDRRVGMVSRLLVDGTDNPWSATVLARSLDHVAQYLDGGSYDIDLADAGAVVLRKGQFQYPLVRSRVEQDYPQLTDPPEVPGATVERSDLVNALKPLVDTVERSKENNCLELCSFFEDGVVAFGEEGISWRIEGPTLPFAVSLYRPDAKRIRRWLRLIGTHSNPSEIHVAPAEGTDGRRSYVFWTADRAHMFQARAERRVFPRGTIEGRHREEALVGGMVDRELLRLRAALLNHGRHWRISCRLGTGQEEEAVLALQIGCGAEAVIVDQLRVEGWRVVGGVPLPQVFEVGRPSWSWLYAACPAPRCVLNTGPMRDPSRLALRR